MSGEGDGRAFLEASRARVDAALERALPSTREAPALLHEAMRYAVLSGGKRLRPALAFAAARACAGDEARVVPVAVAVELVHAYSLVHDDLPAMDNDYERRGQPTVHVKFGEDLAILAGDALLALAFGELGRADAPPAVVAGLAAAAGSRELVGGQVDDLRADRAALTVAQITSIHARKTGALFRFSVSGAAQWSGAESARLAALERFAVAYSSAFQIADDLADGARSETSILQVMDAPQARQAGMQRIEQACEALEPLGAQAAALAGLIALVSERLGTL